MNRQVIWISPFLLLLAAGCVTEGVGTAGGGASSLNAILEWRATGPTEGTMRARISDGRTYDGHFFQITQETQIETIQPLWNGWSEYDRAPGWEHWNPSPQFLTHYSGRVLANMQGTDGAMRCRFILRRPSAGLSGGGEGRCQLPGRVRIRAQLQPH